jgi:hypothetical protein
MIPLIGPVVYVLKVPIQLRWYVGASFLIVDILFRPLDEMIMIWEPVDAGRLSLLHSPSPAVRMFEERRPGCAAYEALATS